MEVRGREHRRRDGRVPAATVAENDLDGTDTQTHQTVRTPLPYGSPIAPAWVTSVRTLAARTGAENAGTRTTSVPR